VNQRLTPHRTFAHKATQSAMLLQQLYPSEKFPCMQLSEVKSQTYEYLSTLCVLWYRTVPKRTCVTITCLETCSVTFSDGTTTLGPGYLLFKISKKKRDYKILFVFLGSYLCACILLNDVRPSVTRRHCVQTANVIFEIFLPPIALSLKFPTTETSFDYSCSNRSFQIMFIVNFILVSQLL